MGIFRGIFIIILVILLIHRLICGRITLAITRAKKRDGSFAWGFWLGLIGILVTACMRSKPETTTSYSGGYVPSAKTAIPEKPAAPATWKCVKCLKENNLTVSFCTTCGERRHYKWTCNKCDAQNEYDAQYCGKCGNLQTEEQEISPMNLNQDEKFLDELEAMTSAADIYDAFYEKFNSVDDNDIRTMIDLLEKTKSSERIYGNMKKYAFKCVKAFFNQNMHFLPVNRDLPAFPCPACYAEQKKDNEFCSKCGALFSR